LLCLLVIAAAPAQGQIITTIAGNGTSGYIGDGVPATSTEIFAPWYVTADGSGNVYLGSGYHGAGSSYPSRIRMVNASGIISTFAGTGTYGFSGDGGPATAAQLYGPMGIATDTTGNVYICDLDNQRIRKVNTSGIISTIAGNGSGSHSGDGGPATAANILNPWVICTDNSGNIYFCEDAYTSIRKINSSGIISTIAGNVGAGPLYYIGEGGPATAASLGAIYALAADGVGNLYLADYSDNRILVINSSGIISTFAGTGTLGYTGDGGPATAAKIHLPSGLAVDRDNNVFITDGSYNHVRKINTAGIISTIAGTGTPGFYGDNGPATAAYFNQPNGVATDPYGNIYVADYNNARIRKIITHEHTPYFTNGLSQNLVVCENTAYDSINFLLPVFDSDYYQPETWSVLSGPSHGTAAGSYTIISACDTMTPHGFYYTPASGYNGQDTFKITVTDGLAFDTIAIYVTVMPVPNIIAGTANVCVGNTITLSDSTSGGAWSSSNANASIGTAGIVTGVSAGNDTIKYTLSTGCMATKGITVNPLPAAITGTMNVCTGQTTLLTDATGSGAWSSSAAAAIGSTGTVTGLSAGTAIITYTLPTGCRTTAPVTVNQSPSVITGTAAVCTGLTTTLSDSTTSGMWASGSGAIATIGSATGVVTGVVSSIFAGTAIITYTAPNGCMAVKTITVNPVPAAIIPASGSFALCTGATLSLSDATSGGAWSSSGASIGTTGIVTGITTGMATISYTLPTGCAASAVVTVSPSPSAISGSTILCLGNTDSLSNSIPGGAWSSSNYDTAFIDAVSGVVTGISTGPATITYTLPSGCFTTTPVTVNSAPSAITGISSVCVGATTLLYNSVGGGVWSCSAPGIASVGSLSGFVTGVSHGSAVVSYSTGTGCTVTFPMAVNPAPVAITGPVAVCKGSVITITDSTTGGVWSSPGSTGIAVLGSTTSLSATITGTGAGLAIISYTIGSTSSGTACAAIKAITVNPLPATITGTLHVCPAGTTTLTSGTGGAWSVASPLLTIGSATGTVTGITHGTGLVSYTLPTGCASIAIVTVNPLPSIISGANSVCVGLTTTLTDSTLTGTWTKSNANVNIGSATGVVTGVTPGTTNIFYTLPFTGCYATKTITVNTSPGAITGSNHVCPGATITLGNAITGGTWASSNTGIATVGSTSLSAGMVTGVSPGVVTVTYSIGAGCSVSATITVNPLPSVITGTMQVCPAQTTILSDSIAGGTWNTTSSFASVGSSTGFVTGVSGGAATITYTSPIGCTRTATVTVNPSPLSIAGPSAVCIGSTISLTDPGGGTWNSSHTSVATIGSTGVVTGDTIGTTTIIYTLPTGCAISTTVTVSLSPTAITGPSTVCQGATISLGDWVGGGLWSSSASSLSIGSLSGVVTGITPGTSTTITYSLGTGCTVTKTVSVIAAPAAITGAGGVCVGSSILLTDPAAGGVWHSSSGSATVGSTGSVTGVSAGSGNISYTVATTGCSAVAVVTVNPLPSAISGPSTVCVGTSITETDTSAGGMWSTTSTGITVGSTGVVTGITSGVSLVTYTTGSCSITKAIMVNTAPVITGTTGLCTGTSTTLSGTGTGTWSTTSSLLTVGSATGVVTAGTTSGAAIITYTSGSGCSATTTVNVSTGPSSIGGIPHVCVGATTDLADLATGGTWTITPTTTSTIGSSSGVVTGVAPGVAVVSYSLGSGCTTNATITVNAAPAAITGAPQVCVDATTTTLSTTSTGGLWSSSPATIATVAPTGIVTGVSAGAATISYTVGGCSATKVVTVNATPSAITGVAAVCEGLTITLTDTTSGGIWSSASALLAVDSVTGMVTGISIGTGIVSYTLPTGCAATKPITVNSAPDAITGLTSVCIGSTTALSDLTGGGTWSSPGTTGIVSLSPTGVVTGMGLGTATISYSVGAASCPAVITVTVNSLPGAISGSPNVCLRATDTLTDIPGGGIWSSSNVLVATVGSATGFVYGVAPGTATINYSLGVGCTVGMTVTVHPAPAAISGSGGVCIGLTSALTDIAGGGTWSSRDTAIATISTTGVVTGRSGGDAVISYTVPIATGVNCAATTTITVNTVPAIEGVRNICASDTLHVSDSISGGAWTSTLVSISAGIVTSYIPGVAMLIYTLGDGCSTNAMLTVNPLPAPIVVSGGSTHICTGHTISLSDVTAGGTWNSSNTTVATIGTSGSVTTSGAGTAEISYAVPTGCAEHVIVTVDVIPSGGTISGTMNVCVGSSITLMDTVLGGFWNASNATATISSGSLMGVTVGTDTISYAVTNVCGTATITKTITINPLPDAGTINGVDSVCVGASITLTDAISGGAWGISNGYATISGAGIVMGVSAGIDTVNYRVTNSCGAAQTTFAVAVDPLPQTGTVTGQTSVCIGELDTLTGAPGGGVWNSSSANATVNDGIVTGVSAGVDSIRYGFTNSCGSTSVGYGVTVVKCDTITGVANVQMRQYANVEIYPNPTKGELNVINAANTEMKIVNLLGQQVWSGKLTTANEVVNIGELIPGIYVVEITDPTTSLKFTKRVVVEQ